MVMSTADSIHDRLFDMIWEAECEDDHELANWTFGKAEQLAHDILKSNPQDDDACYAIALTLYHRHADTSERRACVQWLRKTEQLNPKHRWVPLYLGYQLFDDGEYNLAYKEFARVERDFFTSIDQHWRNLKTDELVLVCRVCGDFPVVSLQDVSTLVTRYVSASEEDWAVPIEIVRALTDRKTHGRFGCPFSGVASELCRLIEGIGYQTAFSEELAQFYALAETAS